MSIHELYLNEQGDIEEVVPKDPEIRAARPDTPSDLPTITTVERLRESTEYEHELTVGKPVRIRQLRASKDGKVIFRDWVQGAGEDGSTPSLVMISRRIYSGDAINKMGIRLDNRTFAFSPTDVYVVPKTK